MALLSGAYFVPQLPEAGAMKLSPYLPWEERAKGIFQFYQGIIKEKLGIYYLGKITGGIKYHFYLKKPVNKPDFKGLKIRVTPIYEPFVRALGGMAAVSAFSILFIMFSICVEVAMRQVFNKPLMWTVEISEYLQVYITFLGAAWVLKNDSAVNFFLFRLAGFTNSIPLKHR